MTTEEITAKLDSLEARAATYVGTPGPAGEVQQRAVAIIGNRRVEVTRRDGRVHHYEVTTPGPCGHVTVAKTRAEAERAVAA